MSSTKAFVIIAVLLVSLASCAEDERKLIKRNIITEVDYVPNENAKSVVTTKDGLHQDKHLRVKRNWPFRSSQQNANIINSYYRPKPGDGWWTRNIQKPLARYVGRSFGDEFPVVRDSIIHHQNQGHSFWRAHQFDTGYHPRNWRRYNRHNDRQELANPYNGYNPYK